MRVLSFCLYGDNPLYLRGALANARSAKQWYPGWEIWFYVGASVPRDVHEQLTATGAKVIHVAKPESPAAMLWRFAPACREGVEAFIVRDCDSRLGGREQAAVDAWLAGGAPLHILRDHPAHRAPILGGMWGAAGAGLAVVADALERWNGADYPGVDQHLLATYVYPQVVRDACIHDAYFCYERHSSPFPTPREADAFVGEVFSVDDLPNEAHRRWIRQAENSRLYRARLKAAGLSDKFMKRGFWRMQV